MLGNKQKNRNEQICPEVEKAAPGVMTDDFLLPLKPLEPRMNGHRTEGLNRQLWV